MTVSEVKELTAFRLANIADTACPDKQDSPGADWLDTVRRVAVEQWEDKGGEVDDDDVFELADGAVEIYTYPRWQIFTDLGAWNEDIDDYGQPEDMTNGAGIALLVIAERLIRALWDMLREDDSEDDES